MRIIRIGLIVALVFWVAVAFVWVMTEDVNAHYTSGCREYRCKAHVIKPYVRGFLGPVGACESGTGSRSLYIGLRAVSSGGHYRGRYQFGRLDWARAGGSGDPVRASATEQAYRAVVWLHRNGRSSWPNC